MMQIASLSTGHRLHPEDGASHRCAVIPVAAPGRLSDLLRLLDAAAAPVDDDGIIVRAWQVRAGATLFHEGAHAGSIYVVRSGAFKCVKTSDDGYEQVLSFASRGDVLGFEALCLAREQFSAVALDDASVFALPLAELDAWRHRHPALDAALQRALSAQLARAGEVSEMMAAVSAEVRLARFLLWLSARAQSRGESPRRLLLRMNRRDIASLLAVAHETVSRAFCALAEWELVRVDNREIEILDLDGLRARTRGTRRTPEIVPPAHHAPDAVVQGRPLRASPHLVAAN